MTSQLQVEYLSFMSKIVVLHHNCMVKWKHLTESSFELISVKFYNTVYCTNTSQSIATSSTVVV